MSISPGKSNRSILRLAVLARFQLACSRSASQLAIAPKKNRALTLE
jgi:hypothetical protein